MTSGSAIASGGQHLPEAKRCNTICDQMQTELVAVIQGKTDDMLTDAISSLQFEGPKGDKRATIAASKADAITFLAGKKT